MSRHKKTKRQKKKQDDNARQQEDNVRQQEKDARQQEKDTKKQRRDAKKQEEYKDDTIRTLQMIQLKGYLLLMMFLTCQSTDYEVVALPLLWWHCSKFRIFFRRSAFSDPRTPIIRLESALSRKTTHDY
jgi:hypothetical protein